MNKINRICFHLIHIKQVLEFSSIQFSSVQSSRSDVFYSTTPWTAVCQAPLYPGVCSKSCLLSWWCYLTISSSAAPSPFVFSLPQHQGLFQWISSSYQVAQVLEIQLQHQSFQWIFRVDFLWDWLIWSLCSPRNSPESLLQHHNSKASILRCSVFFTVQLSLLYMTTGKP